MCQTIDSLVLQAKNGDSEALEKVLVEFGYRYDKRLGKFLGNYYSLLVYGKLDLKDKPTRRLFQLFATDNEVIERLKYNLMNESIYDSIYAFTDYLQHEMMNKLDRRQIKDDLVLMFIEKVHSYKKKSVRVNFDTYISNSFHHDVFTYIQKTLFSEDILGVENDRLTDLIENIAIEDDFTVFEDQYYKDMLNDDTLTIRWTNGHCHEAFKALSVFDRNILKMHYWDKLSDGTIADMMCLHINTIYTRRRKSVDLVQAELAYLLKESYV